MLRFSPFEDKPQLIEPRCWEKSRPSGAGGQVASRQFKIINYQFKIMTSCFSKKLEISYDAYPICFLAIIVAPASPISSQIANLTAFSWLCNFQGITPGASKSSIALDILTHLNSRVTPALRSLTTTFLPDSSY